jgi:hypothetical protein
LTLENAGGYPETGKFCETCPFEPLIWLMEKPEKQRCRGKTERVPVSQEAGTLFIQ